MWAFFDFGLLMPALVPAQVKDRPDVLEWTNNGEYDLQVRGRLSEHLQYFMDNYMEDGTYNPEIQATPDKDYNFRFYTSVEAYAEGIKQAALRIDYEKYKQTSERYPWNKKFHQILNTIWAKVCDLNEPGGFYGPRSEENPNGYDSAHRYSSWGSSWYESAHSEYLGSTFGERAWHEDDIEPEDDETQELLEELAGADLPMSDWWEYTTPAEFKRLEEELRIVFSKKIVRSMRKKNLQKHTDFIEWYNEVK